MLLRHAFGFAELRSRPSTWDIRAAVSVMWPHCDWRGLVAETPLEDQLWGASRRANAVGHPTVDRQ